jgi:hypothetical protein
MKRSGCPTPVPSNTEESDTIRERLPVIVRSGGSQYRTSRWTQEHTEILAQADARFENYGFHDGGIYRACAFMTLRAFSANRKVFLWQRNPLGES